MNDTDARELSDREIRELDSWSQEFDRRNGMNPKEYMRYVDGLARRQRGQSEGYGNVFNGATRLVMWLLGIFAVILVSWGSWISSAVVDSKAEVSTLKREFDLFLDGAIKPGDGHTSGRP